MNKLGHLVFLIIILLLEIEIKSFLASSFLYVFILSIICFLFILNKSRYWAFLCYLLIILLLLFYREENQYNTNLSLDELKKWIPLILKNRTVFLNVIGNIFIYIPFGFYIIYKLNFINASLISFIFIIGMEILQFILNRGILDIGDILLNFIGIILGFILYLGSWFLCVKRRIMKN